MKLLHTSIGSILIIGVFTVSGSARPISVRDGRPMQATVGGPAYCIAEHNIGRLELAVSNVGSYGSKLSDFIGEISCITGERVWSFSFPKGSRSQYLAGTALWVGAVVGRDTLVSTGPEWWPNSACEFHPAESPFGDMVFRSTIDPARPAYEGAVSEQDYICTYSDTCLNCRWVDPDPVLGRPHRPLNIEVTQRSFAWSYAYAQDFVLIDLSIKNIGQERLRKIYMGVYFDVDIYDPSLTGGGQLDDVAGFRKSQPAHYLPESCPPDTDEVNMAWSADNDGDLILRPIPNTTATRIVRTPSDSLEVSFNWWLTDYDGAERDFGPQARRSFRSFIGGALGSPVGDRNKYHLLRNGEIDYDQVRTATIGELDSVWLPPSPEHAASWAMGIGDLQYLLSFGPFQIDPGQSLPITLALVGGINFHSDPDNLLNLPDNPDSWYENVNFDSLSVAATWADWVYDNPGIDTDSDGYAGEFTVCNAGGDSSIERFDTIAFDSCGGPPYDSVCPRLDTVWAFENADTIWRIGDGVPDFRGASPPPAPIVRVESSMGQVRVIWNGVRSETTRDIFSRELDFEGYRVWIARDDRPSSFSVVASYDKEDFNRWEYNEASETFVLVESPFTLTALRCLYADSCTDTTWHPSQYTRIRPLIVPGGPYYFVPQDFNQSILANDPENATTPIKKVYPLAPKPPILDADSIRILYPDGADSIYLTEDGFVKYYEYELVLDNLLPTVPYWINVTAFDYGSPESGLEALETSRSLQPVVAYPLGGNRPYGAGPASGAAGIGNVFVYPNPYRLDGNYRGRGFEDFGADQVDEDRVRSVHFANLPERCTIRIYSLDGDLVRELAHPAQVEMEGRCPITPNEACWDMISRNLQQVVSGLYYWTVEDEFGRSQIGKLVLIL